MQNHSRSLNAPYQETGSAEEDLRVGCEVRLEGAHPFDL